MRRQATGGRARGRGARALVAVALTSLALSAAMLAHEDPEVARYDRWMALRGCVDAVPTTDDERRRCAWAAGALREDLEGVSGLAVSACSGDVLGRARLAFEAARPLSQDDRACLSALGDALMARAWGRRGAALSRARW